jgi:hypothetical protein
VSALYFLSTVPVTTHLDSRSLLRGLKFVQAGFFVNTSRIKPNLLVVEGSYLRIATTKRLAVGIMLGVVSACFILDDAIVGSQRSPYAVHKITIAPFAQEMRRDSSVWGLAFGFKRSVPGPMGAGGFSFSTRKKAETPAGGSTASTKNGIFTTIATSLSGSRNAFSTSRGFEENGLSLLCLPIFLTY